MFMTFCYVFFRAANEADESPDASVSSKGQKNTADERDVSTEMMSHAPPKLFEGDTLHTSLEIALSRSRAHFV
jgi:hypothetical protein